MEVESTIQQAKVCEELEPLYVHIRERLDQHRESAVKRNLRYKRWATFLNYSLPFLSLTLTLLITQPFSGQSLKIVVGGLVASVLTILSYVNSTMKPMERYHGYVAAAIEIQAITLSLELGMRSEAVRGSKGEAEYLQEINDRLTKVGEAMANLPIPRLAL